MRDNLDLELVAGAAIIGVGAVAGIVAGPAAGAMAGTMAGSISAVILESSLLVPAVVGASVGALLASGVTQGAGSLSLGMGLLGAGLMTALLEVVNIMQEEEITLISAAKLIFATTPLYWGLKIISLAEEGVGSNIMRCIDALAAQIVTSVIYSEIFSGVQNYGLKLCTVMIASTQLVDAYDTWNKYSALEAETGESEGSKLPVVGLQLLTFAASTILLSSAGVGLLTTGYIPIILGAAQLALHLYADKVIADKREGIVQAEMARG